MGIVYFRLQQTLEPLEKVLLMIENILKKTNAEGKSTTYCNFAAQAIVVKGGHNRVKGTATEMVEFLQNKNNATTITQEQAQSFANAADKKRLS